MPEGRTQHEKAGFSAEAQLPGNSSGVPAPVPEQLNQPVHLTKAEAEHLLKQVDLSASGFLSAPAPACFNTVQASKKAEKSIRVYGSGPTRSHAGALSSSPKVTCGGCRLASAA